MSLNPQDTSGREVGAVFESKNRKVSLREILDELDGPITCCGGHRCVRQMGQGADCRPPSAAVAIERWSSSTPTRRMIAPSNSPTCGNLKEERVRVRARVRTAFNKMLVINRASVAGVEFTGVGIVVSLQRRRREHVSPCRWKTWALYDRSIRRWRHLDLGSTRRYLEAEIVRIDCRRCGRVRTEVLPWV